VARPAGVVTVTLHSAPICAATGLPGAAGGPRGCQWRGPGPGRGHLNLGQSRRRVPTGNRDNPAGPPRRHGRQCPARDQDRGLRRCQPERGPHDSDARRGCRKVGLALSEATSRTHGGDHRGPHSPRHSVATCTAGRAEWLTAVGFTMLTSMASGLTEALSRERLPQTCPSVCLLLPSAEVPT
jgi:hypothetical protein